MATIQITSAGLNQIAGGPLGIQGSSAAPQITWIAIGGGAGLLSSALSSGVNYTSLSLQSALPLAIATGTSMTIVNGTQTQTVTLSGPANIGDFGLAITSFNANANYGVGTGVLTTPAATDTQLNNEVFRKQISSATAGVAAGEGLYVLYVAPTDITTQTILEIGWYAGAASGTANSGVLVARAIYWWQHTYNADSGSAQLDMTI